MPPDSLDKIITQYFAAVTRTAFTYKGREYAPVTLRVVPEIFNGFTCPSGCGGCCTRFSLDYLPSEELPYEMPLRAVEFNNTEILLYSDTQRDADAYYCENLNKESGRCSIHGRHPFSCDFELIRFTHFLTTSKARVTTRLYGRGWNMMRVDNVRGALCTVTPPTFASLYDTIRKLKRLAEWCEHFGLEHHIQDIIKWGETRPTSPLIIPATRKKGFF